MGTTKLYRLTAADGTTCESREPGTFGGYGKGRIYGRLDCSSALRALPNDYARHRVFFADEAAAIAAGYGPCGTCMRERYQTWKGGAMPGTGAYPWLRPPKPG